MDIKKSRPILLYLLLALLFFLGMAGGYGGVMLIADPSGKALGLNIRFLRASPFTDYLFPGIILFIFNGLFPLLIFYALLKQPSWEWPERINIYTEYYWQWTLSLYSGIILVIWIFIQLLLVGYLGNIQAVYGLLGIVILVLTLTPVIKDHFLKPPEYL